MYELSRKSDSNLIIPAPKGLEYFPFQKAGIEYAYRNANHNTLIADEPGLGKTIQAIGFCNISGAQNIIVICPASLIYNWEKEIRLWHVGNPTIELIRSGKQRLNPKADVHIISYSLLINVEIHKFLQAKRPDCLIIDEVHYLKNYEARRTQATYSSQANLVDCSSNVIALSGTPIVNRPKEIFSTIKKLCPQAIDDIGYEQFARKYCGAYQDEYGWHDDGATNMKELGRRMRSHFMIRRLKKNVLKDLPEKTINIVELDPTREAKRIIKDMNKFDLNEVADWKTVGASYEGLSSMRKELGIEKIGAIVEYVKAQLEVRKKVVVFAHHREVLVLIHEALEKFGSVLIYGSTPKAKRQEYVDRFQEDPSCRVFVGSIMACGVGITLTASDYLCFGEPDWVPGNNDQVIDRVHRIGQRNAVIADFLVYRDSLDQNILKSQSKKALNIKEIMA